MPPLSNMPSWRGAQLKHMDKFTFTYLYVKWYKFRYKMFGSCVNKWRAESCSDFQNAMRCQCYWSYKDNGRRWEKLTRFYSLPQGTSTRGWK